jgi:hypothetical protein
VEIRQVSATELATLREKLTPMMDAYVQRVSAKGIDGQKLIDFFQAP